MPSGGDRQDGSILLPVLLLLLVLASAATAMTLQARTSLREEATRRTRLALTLDADGAVRAAALALATATAGRTAPPFAVDGTPEGCRFGTHDRLILSVQDEGGRADLNKGAPELLLMLLQRSGLGGPDAKMVTDAIVARRDDGTGVQGSTPPQQRPAKVFALSRRGFALADEIDGLPGLSPELVERVRPMFTVNNTSAGLDAEVAAPAVRAVISRRELASPASAAFLTPSDHATFTITATIGRAGGPQATREALFHLDPTRPLGRFLSWNAPVQQAPSEPVSEGVFCRRIAGMGDPAGL